MKKILKIVVGLIMIASLAIGFLPFIRLGGLEFSVFDLFMTAAGKTVTGNYNSLGVQLVSQLQELSEKYLGPYLVEVAVVAVTILLAAILTIVLSWRVAYYISVISALVSAACTVMIFLQIKPELDTIGSSLDFFGLDEAMRIESLTPILWCLVWALILILAVYGIIVSREKNIISADEIPEIESFPLNSKEKTDSETPERTQKFEGAIISRNQFFGNRAYQLRDRMEVFFAGENGNVYLTDTESGGIFAGVYFICKYQEYCIDVWQNKSVYLSCGQPLGAGRRYYIPRGVEIYLKKQDLLFELA